MGQLNNSDISLCLHVVSPDWWLQGRQIFMPTQSSQGMSLGKERLREREREITSTTFSSLSYRTEHTVAFSENTI